MGIVDFLKGNSNKNKNEIKLPSLNDGDVQQLSKNENDKEESVNSEGEEYHPFNTRTSDELELSYRKDSQLATGVDLRASLFVMKGLKVDIFNNKGEQDNTCKKIENEVFTPLFERSNFETESLPVLQRNIDVHGKSALLYITGQKTGKIINLRLVPRMKYFDYKRQGYKHQIVKENNAPIGYTWKPDGINKIFKGRDEAVMFVRNTLGGFEPHSLIDCLYGIITYKNNIEDGIAQSIWRKGHPMIVATWKPVPGIKEDLTRQDMENMNSKLKNLVSAKHNLVCQPGWEIQLLESGEITKLHDVIKHYLYQIAGRLSVPIPYLIGTTEGGSNLSSPAPSQKAFMLDTIKAIQRYWKVQIEDHILTPVLKNYGYDNYYGKVTFGEIKEADLDKIADRVKKTGYLYTVEEAREALGLTPEKPESNYPPIRQQGGFTIQQDDKEDEDKEEEK